MYFSKLISEVVKYVMKHACRRQCQLLQQHCSVTNLQGNHSFIHSFRLFLERLFKSITTQRWSRCSMDTVSEFHAKAPQVTASEGLSQGPYVATRAGFEPTWLYQVTTLKLGHRTMTYLQSLVTHQLLQWVLWASSYCTGSLKALFFGFGPHVPNSCRPIAMLLQQKS